MTGDSTGQQDLRTYLRIFWRWKFLFLGFVIVIPLGVYLLENSKPKIYQSSTLVQLQDVTQGVGVSGGPVESGNLAAVARLVTTTPVTEVAAGILHQPPSSLAEVSATADTKHRLHHDHHAGPRSGPCRGRRERVRGRAGSSPDRTGELRYRRADTRGLQAAGCHPARGPGRARLADAADRATAGAEGLK